MNVVIVELDAMNRQIITEYLDESDFQMTLSPFSDIYELKENIGENPTELVIIDTDHIDMSINDIVSSIRNILGNTDIVIISSNTEKDTVKTAFAYGVLDYLIKPYSRERLLKAVELSVQKSFVLQDDILDQKTIDQWVTRAETPDKKASKDTNNYLLEKGLLVHTLKHILDTFVEIDNWASVEKISAKTDISHVTVRKYLDYLERVKRVETRLNYGKTGRPAKQYRLIS